MILACLVVSSYLGQRIPKVVFSLSKNYGNDLLYTSTIWELFWLMIGIFFTRASFASMEPE